MEHFTSVTMSQDGRVIIAATTISDPYERIDKIYINSAFTNPGSTRQIALSDFTTVKSRGLLSYYNSCLKAIMNGNLLIGGLKSVASSDGKSIYLSQESTSFLMISQDYGATFQPSHSRFACQSLDASDQGHVWCATKSQVVHKSVDYGQNFIETRFLFKKVSVSSDGQVLLALDKYSNMHQSFDYGRSWDIFAGGAIDFLFTKENLQYFIQNKNTLYNGYLTLPEFAKCEIGYYSSTGTGPACTKCPEEATNQDFASIGIQTCTYCRNGYFGFNGKVPCYKYSGWAVHFLICLYTIIIFVASFLFTNRVRLFRRLPDIVNQENIEDKHTSAVSDSTEVAVDESPKDMSTARDEEMKDAA